jgi:hypothetical protein
MKRPNNKAIPCPLQNIQGVAGIKKGEFEVEAQFLSKLNTNNSSLLLKFLLKGTKNEAQFLKVTVSYCPRPPVGTCGAGRLKMRRQWVRHSNK